MFFVGFHLTKKKLLGVQINISVGRNFKQKALIKFLNLQDVFSINNVYEENLLQESTEAQWHKISFSVPMYERCDCSFCSSNLSADLKQMFH